ncbi:MAG: hypothetical protein QOI82_2872 [Actinomycetota bacterium]|jgi:hypothetical protein|nr:hypothetical protein [Actinomycetota bacterium]
MSDLFGTTSASTAPTATYDRTGYEPSTADRTTSSRSPLSDVHVEEPRRHPLTYAALALSVLALLLAIAALAQGNGNDVSRVRVGNNDCVSVAQDSGPAALYCRTGALPNG